MKKPKQRRSPATGSEKPKGKGTPVVRPVEAAEPPKTQSGKTGSSMRILVVEDHADTRRSVQRLLEISGHRVWAAASAAEALQLAAGHSFDLVVSDIGLPDQSGHEVMTQLRRLYGLSGIALSGYDEADAEERNREAGFVDHLTKPIGFEELKTKITHFSLHTP